MGIVAISIKPITATLAISTGARVITNLTLTLILLNPTPTAILIVILILIPIILRRLNTSIGWDKAPTTYNTHMPHTRCKANLQGTTNREVQEGGEAGSLTRKRGMDLGQDKNKD
jgi:hypothetical protein